MLVVLMNRWMSARCPGWMSADMRLPEPVLPGRACSAPSAQAPLSSQRTTTIFRACPTGTAVVIRVMDTIVFGVFFVLVVRT